MEKDKHPDALDELRQQIADLQARLAGTPTLPTSIKASTGRLPGERLSSDFMKERDACKTQEERDAYDRKRAAEGYRMASPDPITYTQHRAERQ